MILRVAVPTCELLAAFLKPQYSQHFFPSISEGRTFGHHFLKRMSFAVVPTAFVVGVITTLLSALTVVSMKGLGVGVSRNRSVFLLVNDYSYILFVPR